MSTACKTLEALVELGRSHDSGLDDFKERDLMAYYEFNNHVMSITLRRPGHQQFTGEWFAKARKIAAEEGYPASTVTMDSNGLAISFTR
jgi:hypothetical protein